MALSIAQIAGKANRLRSKYAARDGRMGNILAIRQGDADAVMPGLFPEAWPKPIIANFCDVAARDLAELIAPLPSFNCSSASMVTDTARKFADKRTKIAHYYTMHADLGTHMYRGADAYLTYGFLPFVIEPDFANNCPRIRVEDPMGSYPEFDRWGECVSLTTRFTKTVADLCVEYPEYIPILTLQGQISHVSDSLVEAVRYIDADQQVMFIPSRGNLTLHSAPNPLGECPVVVAVRPTIDDQMRGQFDDVLFVQLARAQMALYGLDATRKSVQAPLALPDDVQEISFGADSVLRSRTPEKIRRVGVELPQGSFIENQQLDQEMRVGARYPEARSGTLDASVITGRGVQELTAGFDTQVKTAQDVLARTFRKVLRLCFLMDEKFWSGQEKTVRGNVQGTPYEIKYRPSRDIVGDHTVDVSYGFMAGLDPNRAVVLMLQLRGDKLISRDQFQRQLPFGIDVTAEQQRIDVEELREALKQAVYAYASTVPMLAEQGADPAAAFTRMASIIESVQKGKAVEEAITTAFAPTEPPPGALTPEAGAPVPGAPAESAPGGGPFPTAPGQAELGPGGRPDWQSLVAGLSAGGQPNMSASVSRRVPA